MLAATASARNLPQAMYNGYIGLMQRIADLVDADRQLAAADARAEPANGH